MKFLFTIITFSVLAAVFAATSVSTNSTTRHELKPIKKKQSHCPRYCTNLENPVCALNSYNKCIAAFGNPCKLDAYNCNRYKRDQFVREDSKHCKNFKETNYLYCW